MSRLRLRVGSSSDTRQGCFKPTPFLFSIALARKTTSSCSANSSTKARRPPEQHSRARCTLDPKATSMRKAVEIVPTRENNSYRPGRRRGRVGFRKLDRLGSPELVPDVIDLTIEGDRVEKDWMKEVEIEYTPDGNTDEADPLEGPVDWAGASTGQAGNRMPEQLVTESLTLVADKITFCLESDNADEELMDEAEIEYTREDSEVEVDPLGDAHSVLPEQKNLGDTLDYGCGEIEYINVDGSCFDVKDDLQPRNSTVLFVDVYDAKPKTANVTETPNRCNSGKQRKSYACRLCNYRTSNRTDLHHHCRAHHGEKSFESAVKHVGQPTKGKPGTCSVCGKTFSQIGVLRLHMKAHKRDQPNVRNSRNGKTGPSRKRKKSPTSVTPEPSPNTGAEDNGIKQKDAYDDTTGGVKDPLTYNEQVPENDCTAMTEKRYRCKSCKYRSSRQHDLKKHELTHSAQKLHQCTVCSYRCKRAGYLKMHMGLHHDPKTCSDAAIRSGSIHRIYDCTICHYQTRQMGNLRVHMRTHTGEKPFACKVCNERFTQNGSLKVHMRLHTGEKPYLCNACGKGFAQLTGLNNHSQTCSHPPRPVKSCYIRNYSCTRFRDLLNHTKTHSAIRIVRLQKADIMPLQQGSFN